MDVRIGIIQTAKEIDVEIGTDVAREDLLADVEAALRSSEGILWLTDKRGRKVAVPSAKVAYVEIGAAVDERRVGFGAR